MRLPAELWRTDSTHVSKLLPSTQEIVGIELDPHHETVDTDESNNHWPRQIVTERPAPFFSTLRRIRQPTLVIFGALDRLVPPRLGVKLVQHMPNATLVLLPEVGHVPQFEAREETLGRIRAFLDSTPPGKLRS